VVAVDGGEEVGFDTRGSDLEERRSFVVLRA